jgi:hypothetical protein
MFVSINTPINQSRPLTSPLSLGVPVPLCNPVYARSVGPSTCERIRAENLSEGLLLHQLRLEPIRITKLIQRQVRLVFVGITFRDGTPRKTRGGYTLGLSSLYENHPLYTESVFEIPTVSR